MSNLRSTIETLASSFAADVLAALRGASLEELVSVTSGGRTHAVKSAGHEVGNGKRAAAPAPRGRGGRRVRRSKNDLAGMITKIVAALAKSEAGLRSEQLRDALGVQAKELPRPLKEALSSGAITKMGERRGTVYFAGSKKRTSK